VQKYDAGNPQQPMDEDIAITSGYVHRARNEGDRFSHSGKYCKRKHLTRVWIAPVVSKIRPGSIRRVECATMAKMANISCTEQSSSLSLSFLYDRSSRYSDIRTTRLAFIVAETVLKHFCSKDNAYLTYFILSQIGWNRPYITISL